MHSIGVDLGVIVFFLVVAGPRRDDVIVEEFVRCVPGPGECFEVVERVWPGIAKLEGAIFEYNFMVTKFWGYYSVLVPDSRNLKAS
jgi:hypothetical protein